MKARQQKNGSRSIVTSDGKSPTRKDKAFYRCSLIRNGASVERLFLRAGAVFNHPDTYSSSLWKTLAKYHPARATKPTQLMSII